MKESEKYSVNEEFSSPTANEPEALYGVSSKASRIPLHQEHADDNEKGYLTTEEAFRYYHPDAEVESISDIDVRTVPLKEMLTHGMTLEESERRITEKIYNFYEYKA